DGGPERDRHALRAADADGRSSDAVQVHHQERRASERKNRDVYAEAVVRRQWFRYALPPKPLERQRESVFRCKGLCAHITDGKMVHRRSARALTRTPRALRSDNQFVPATGARLRSAGESHLLAADPARRRAN